MPRRYDYRVPAADAAGDYEMVDCDRDPEENSDSDDDAAAAADDIDDDGDDKDKDDENDDDHIRPDEANSIDDADDSIDTNFNEAHQPLQGSFKTAEGITISLVKGSIAAQKVYMSYFCLVSRLGMETVNVACKLVGLFTLPVVRLVYR